MRQLLKAAGCIIVLCAVGCGRLLMQDGNLASVRLDGYFLTGEFGKKKTESGEIERRGGVVKIEASSGLQEKIEGSTELKIRFEKAKLHYKNSSVDLHTTVADVSTALGFLSKFRLAFLTPRVPHRTPCIGTVAVYFAFLFGIEGTPREVELTIEQMDVRYSSHEFSITPETVRGYAHPTLQWWEITTGLETTVAMPKIGLSLTFRAAYHRLNLKVKAGFNEKAVNLLTILDFDYKKIEYYERGLHIPDLGVQIQWRFWRLAAFLALTGIPYEDGQFVQVEGGLGGFF